MKNQKKIRNHEEMSLGDLGDWLDERGFNHPYEVLDFIESSIPRRLKRDIVRRVKASYNQMADECGE